MKTMIGMTAVLVLVVAIFSLLGLAEANHMLIFGLLLAMFSELVTIALASAAKVQSLCATFEPTAAVAEYKPSILTIITDLHNYPRTVNWPPSAMTTPRMYDGNRPSLAGGVSVGGFTTRP